MSKIAEEQQRWIERQREARDKALAEAYNRIDLLARGEDGARLVISISRRRTGPVIDGAMFGSPPDEEEHEYELPPVPPTP